MPTLTRQLVDAASARAPAITRYTIPAPDGVGTVDVYCRDMDSTPYSYLDLVDSLRIRVTVQTRLSRGRGWGFFVI